MAENKTFPNDPTATMQAGAPTPAAPKTKAGKSKAKLTKTGKVRKARQPRQVDPRIVALQSEQVAALAEFKENQARAMTGLKLDITREKEESAAAAKAESLVAKLTPEEQRAVIRSMAAKLPGLIPECGEGKAA